MAANAIRDIPSQKLLQRLLEQQLEGLEGVRNIHDDIIVLGEGETYQEVEQNHDKRLHALSQRCENRNIVLNSSERKFLLKQQSLAFFQDRGISLDPKKAQAITEMPQQDDQAALRRFLGIANCLSRLVPR